MPPRPQLAGSLPPVDLSQCEREPVHLPGTIQPHGVLLVVDPRDLTIVGVSENAADLLRISAERLLGRGIASLVSPDQADDVAEGLSHEDVEQQNPFMLRLASGETVKAIAHRHDGRLLVECEPDLGDLALHVTLANRVRGSLARLRAATDLRDLCERTAREVRQLTGFDRVLVYAFEPDWTGKVVAEDCVDGRARFLGARFPASDIPSQARALYTQCRLRAVPTASYTPARILGVPDGRPLDLTHATLRSISPVHLQYMRNMGVTASLGISLMREGRLWGIVTCNHESGARATPYAVRSACGFVGEVVSSLIDHKEEVALAEARGRSLATRAELLTQLLKDGDVVRALTQQAPSILDVMSATGAVLFYDDELHCVGATPPRAALRDLVAWVDEQEEPTLVVASLPKRYPNARAWADIASGLVATSISFADTSVVSQKIWLLWFRPEAIQTVTWGGDPRKQACVEDNGQLRPRTSFEQWRQEVHLTCVPFEPAAIEAATSLGARLAIVILEVEAGRQIRARKKSLQLVLDATGDGLVLVGRDGRLLAERSRAVEQWFRGPFDRALLWDVLFPDDERSRRELELTWKQLASDRLPVAVAADQMQRELTHDGRFFLLGFKDVREGRALTAILVTLEDVTERMAALRAAADAAEAQAILGGVLRDARGFGRALAELTSLSKTTREAELTAALHALHTLKGNAGVLGLSTLAARCHELEDRVAERPDRGLSATDLAEIDEELARVGARVHEVAGEGALERVEVAIGELTGAIALLEMGADPALVLAELRRWTLEPATRQLTKLAARAAGLARELGKSIDVVVVDRKVRMAADALAPLWSALLHAVSNAVDHGIEPEEVRRAHGKPSRGRIVLSAEESTDGWVSLAVADDGAGVDLDAMRVATARRGLPSATHDDLIEALFADAVTTRSVITETSGRGVGLAALRETCARLGGTVDVETERGAGTTIRARVPAAR